MKLNIGLVAPLPPPYGGMANQANQLKQLLQQEPGINVSFVQTNSPYTNAVLGEIKGLRAVVRLISYVGKIFQLAGRVDVIHVLANSGWSWQLFSAPVIWIAYFRKTSVIINYRGGEAKSYFESSIQWVKPSMTKANVIVVPSGYLKDVFSEFDFDTQIIPNIINLERFQEKPKKESKGKQLHLIITRNLEAIYGIEIAIKALAIAKKDIPFIKLSIAGSGPQKEELQEIVSNLGLDDNVTFTGKLLPEQVAELYQDADIMLNPTTVDNMPNSVLEAMASGVAIVTTNVGGVPYIVEDNKTGLLVDVNDAEAMAEKIIRLFNNSELHNKLVVNGLVEVQQYAWVHVKKQWIDLYKAVKDKK